MVRLHEEKKPVNPRQREMLEGYVSILRKELDAFRSGETTHWVAGTDAKKSLALLADAAKALAALKETPPNVEAAKSVPLLSNDACDPKL